MGTWHDGCNPFNRLHEANTLFDVAQSLATCQWLAALTDAEMAVWPRRNAVCMGVTGLYDPPDEWYRVAVLLN